MYYVDREQIENRLKQIPVLMDAAQDLKQNWNNSVVNHLAQERALHLAIEIVTDVGSLLIDGFIMRDASSYEDIIDIIAQEGVLNEEVHTGMRELVQLRKPLVQSFADWERTGLHPTVQQLSGLMPQFAASVRSYLERELV
ncbi:DUF86 domain-containing protein [Paenibacillus sp. UMB4589-SE434]|uniref:DUF86 domain-containing protein n=1 Tax=Paenibacillus sp. UMB4589-SE434 TaxID=3046314 RepID=UPI00254CB55E|nr:DUF86 domain-containing protein [Paenibacillus sp. UMB4589-SE434]MDK8182410.1 DUF86 domain-containing protein [Paenibacillus sp. UMB4589-SE434]